MSRVPVVAITGYMHEVNVFADPITLGYGLQVAETPGGLGATWEAGPAMRRLRELRDVEFLECPLWEFGASGPLLDRHFRTVVEQVTAALRTAPCIDAVLVMGHGAGRTEIDLDADATFVRAVRSVVGDDVPVVMVFDFHANMSPELCDLVDVVVGYRTNPHVDITERAVEAAEHLHHLLDGHRTVVAMCRPPLVLPQLAQNTLPGEPLGDVRELAESRAVAPVRNVSVFGGFSLADVPDGGLAVCVTADRDAPDVAAAVAEEVATAAWEVRARYRTRATPVADAVEEASRAAADLRSPVILADTADNPGGGAPGNSTFLLHALVEAEVHDVVMGMQCDRAVVDAAWAAGVGASLTVTFNEGSERSLAAPFTATATVLALVDAPLVPTKGVYDGSTRHAGRCCALDLGGVRIAVSSHKVQCADDDTLLHVGLDPSHAKVVAVKSRGHFRAGFAHLFGNDQIIEVGTPGVASAEIHHLQFQHVRRPAFPLDDVTEWTPVVTLHRGAPS